MELFIIRHGESVTNTSKTLLADGGLTEHGGLHGRGEARPHLLQSAYAGH
jgi:bisphosphoglycerate-dependent phosphoglycerate mutase